jgi:hypothetical protein
MKRQKSCGPRLGKLVHQLPGVVTFAYDLRFRRVIARWKGIVEEIHFGGSIMPLAIIENLDLEKTSFRPSKWPRKLKPAKNSKLPKWPENCFEPFGKGGWPLISTWISPSGKRPHQGAETRRWLIRVLHQIRRHSIRGTLAEPHLGGMTPFQWNASLGRLRTSPSSP